MDVAGFLGRSIWPPGKKSALLTGSHAQKSLAEIRGWIVQIIHPHPAWKKTSIRKLQQLLHPDSVFDDLGLIEITTTSSTKPCIETL
jgi:hypothetical protein